MSQFSDDIEKIFALRLTPAFIRMVLFELTPAEWKTLKYCSCGRYVWCSLISRGLWKRCRFCDIERNRKRGRERWKALRGGEEKQ